MPDLERRGETAVTLPMAELLAEARLPSPWDGLSGQADFDHILAQTIDELEIMDRVRACQRIDEATDQERRLLIAMACYGWTTAASYEALSRDTGIRADIISRHSSRLRSKEILRVTTVHLANGRRIRLFTLSGRHLMLAYRRWKGDDDALGKSSSAEANGRSSAPAPAGSALDKSSSAPSCALDDLVVSRPISPPSTLVSSYIYNQETDDERLTNVPAGQNSPALDDLPSAPAWWERFVAHVGRVPRPRPKAPTWLALASLIYAGVDPRAELLREACARFLDVYSQPQHAPVRSLRAVVRSIYLGLLDQPRGGRGEPPLYATETWLADEPEPAPDEVPYRVSPAYGPFLWELGGSPAGPGQPSPREIWRAVLGNLQAQLPRPTFETWLKALEGLHIAEETFTVSAPTAYSVDWVERRMYQALARELEKVTGRPLEIVFVVRSESPTVLEDPSDY